MKNQQIHIRSALESDIGQIADLMNSIFGEYKNVDQILLRWIKEEGNSLLVADADQKIIGVSTWGIYKNKDYSKYDSFGNSAQKFLKDKKAILIFNLAVDANYRKQGVGLKLSIEQMKWVRTQSADILFGASWLNGTDDRSAHLFEKFQFQKLGESHEFLQQQLTGKASCSVCKTDNCSCRAILYGSSVSDVISGI